MGTPGFSVPVLENLIKSEYEVVLVVTQPDRPRGRRRELTPPPVKVAAEKYNIPIFQPEQLKNDYKKIIDLNPDLIVTAAYGQLLPNELLATPKHGAINVHASLLPELRGGAPIHYAILQGKSRTGITIMDMVEQLDAGDIISQKEVEITQTETVGSLHDKLSTVGAELLMKTLPKIFNKEAVRVPQDESKATFAPNISREDEKIDWSKSSQTIYDQIRGLCPWPVAYTTYNGKNMKIWSAQLTDGHVIGAPGEVIQILDKNEGIVVGTNDNKGIIITELQAAGRKRMAVKDYLQGKKDRVIVGSYFGDEQ